MWYPHRATSGIVQHPLSTVHPMAWQLTVGSGLAALVDPLADELSHVPADPFAAQLVAVPGEGVRSWLTWQLSQRLGGGDGVVANIEWVFPSSLVRRALGGSDLLDPWGVDALTWAVHEVVSQQAVAGLPDAEPDLARSRAIADLFDRYGTRRPGMVAAWEQGHDVDAFGRPLPAAQSWQPRMWRALTEHLGAPSSAVQAFARLARLTGDGPPDDLPERLVLVGITALPPFSLEVVGALARHRHVAMLSSVPSPDLWRRLGDVVTRHHHVAGRLDVARADDPTAFTARHPLLIAWGRSSRESQYLLADAARAHGVTASIVDLPEVNSSWLSALHRDLVADRSPTPVGLDVDHDRSIRWHRCHGAARQAEVVRDVLLHLFEERDEHGRPRFEPRDVGVLCSDVATLAPLLQAAFAGAPEQGIAAIPVRVADRTLGGEAPLVEVVDALVGLFDRRWRRDDVLAFARLPAVRQRFGFTDDQVAMIADWLDLTHVRWGLTPDDHRRAGLPDQLEVHSLRSGLDQLVVGAAVASGHAVGPGGVAATGELEGDDVEVLGAFADLVDRLARAVDQLVQPTTVHRWVQCLLNAVADLSEVPDADAWHWGALRREVTSFADAAEVAGSTVDVEPTHLGDLIVARLRARSARVRFDTGAVTVSSLAGQRGVPRRVICLVGLDEAWLSTGPAAADDLAAAQPVVGDPDARAEMRAVLLDAVLAAGERLALFSNGFDVRTNDEVAPAVALAELIDSIDQVAGGAEVRHRWVIDHPRQSWSPRSFEPGALGEPGPFSFHRGALAMFERARATRHSPPMLDGVLPPETGDVELAHAASAFDNAVEALLRDRCGLSLPDRSERTSASIPLSVGTLDSWTIRDDALRAALQAPPDADPAAVIAQRLGVAQRRGAVPPLALGTPTIEAFHSEVMAIVDEARRLGVQLGDVGSSIDLNPTRVVGADRRVRGRVDVVGAHQLVRLTTSRFQPGHLLRAWFELAAVTLTQPDRPWEAIVVSRAARGGGVAGRLLRLTGVEAALEVITAATQFTTRARQSVLPLTASVSEVLYREGERAARSAWTSEFGPATDRWMQWALGDTEFDELLTLAPWPDETGDLWGTGAGRLQRWSHRLWATFDATIDAAIDAAIDEGPGE